MKERKKEKRYFVDFIDNVTKLSRFVVLLIAILLFILGFIISCKMYMSEYSDTMNSYSVDTYKYLEEIGTTTVKDGYIDTSLLPNDVLEYNISYNKYSENTVYTYSLDVNNNLEFIPTPQINITLSNEYEMLSEDSVYSSKEKYVNAIKTSIYVNSFLIGGISLCYGAIPLLIIGFITYRISKAHKKRDFEKIDSESNDLSTII